MTIEEDDDIEGTIKKMIKDENEKLVHVFNISCIRVQGTD